MGQEADMEKQDEEAKPKKSKSKASKTKVLPEEKEEVNEKADQNEVKSICQNKKYFIFIMQFFVKI